MSHARACRAARFRPLHDALTATAAPGAGRLGCNRAGGDGRRELLVRTSRGVAAPLQLLLVVVGGAAAAAALVAMPAFKKGESLMVTHTDGQEYAAKVVDVGKRGVKVHYIGWKKSW